MSELFQFIIVGSGGISSAYAQAITNIGGAAIAGLVSRSGNRPDWLGADTPVFDSITNANIPFNAVVLATPNGTHSAAAIEAANLGKHVLTEKVLEVTAAAMDAMIDACDQADVKLSVTFQRRMSPDNAAVKKLIDSGELGKLYAADMQVKFYRDEAYYSSGAYRGGWAIDGGGPFIQQAAHNADLMCWFFGLPDRVVSMCDRFMHDIETEDHGMALLHYPGGMIGSFCASSICKPGFPTRLEIHCERGGIVMENDQITQWHIEGIDNPAQTDFDVHDGASSATVADTQGHEAILKDFMNACQTGAEPAVTGKDGRRATDLVLQIYANNVIEGVTKR